LDKGACSSSRCPHTSLARVSDSIHNGARSG
jgi:hypothetical protein